MGQSIPLETLPQRVPPAAAAGSRLRPLALLLAPVLLFISVRPFFAQTEPDYWWHVRTGQYIFETGALPRSDIYSYTAVGRPWVTHEWLTELLLYLTTHLAGYIGAVIVFALITGATWLLVYLTCRAWGMGELGATVVMACSYLMAAGSVNVRPQSVTMFFLAALALLLTLYRHGKTRALYVLPPLFALWVNLHGGYAIGMALLWLAVAGQVADAWLHRPVVSPRPLVVSAVASVLATLINPHGLAALTYPFSYAGAGNASMLYLTEWQSPDFHVPYFLVFAASLLVAMIIGLRQHPLGTTDVLWTLLLAFLGLRSGRHIALYAIVITPLIGARLQADLPALGRTLATWRSTRILALIWPVMILGVLVQANDAAKTSSLQFGRQANPSGYPEGGVQYIRDNNLQGNVLNQYEWGGYLIYKLYPERKVFIDGRPDVYGDEFVDKYFQVTFFRPTWRAVLDDYKIDIVLVKDGSALADVLDGDPGWQQVYKGTIERIFIRRRS